MIIKYGLLVAVCIAGAKGQTGGVITGVDCSSSPQRCPFSITVQADSISCNCTATCSCAPPVTVGFKVYWSVTGTGRTGTGQVSSSFGRLEVEASGSLYLYCYPSPNESGSGFDQEDCEGRTSGNSFHINCGSGQSGNGN